MKRLLALVLSCLGIVAFAMPALGAATPTETPDGLKLVKRPGLDTVYVREGVSLAKYQKVMLDPVEVSFDKNWDPAAGHGLAPGSGRSGGDSEGSRRAGA
jgi:hypothetical protein